MDIIKNITEEQIRTDLPQLNIGDTVKVYFKVIEGTRERVQMFEGTIIKKQGGGIAAPGLSGSPDMAFGDGSGGSGGKGGGGGRKTAEDIATGGTRNTSINMNISKFFDCINVYMNDKTDTAELERVVLQSINRSLAIATSTE